MRQLRKERGCAPKSDLPEAITICISAGETTIIDYTHNDEYKALMLFLGMLGCGVEVKTESWCG